VSDSEQGNDQIIQYQLSRGLVGVQFEDYVRASITNNTYDFEGLNDLAKKYDFTKENPDPTNIRIFPAPSSEEVERQRRLSERNDNPEYVEALKSCYLDNQIDEIENPTTEEMLRIDEQLDGQNDCLERVKEEFLP
jgi:hypothetical protein